MKNKSTILAFAFVAMLSAGQRVTAQCHPHHNHHHQITEACDLRTDMRKLWEDHITWTRNVIFNILDGLPGTNEAVARLLQNQVDIGDAFKPYFGNAAGNKLTNLLYGHINTAAALLTALHNNDAAALSAANTAWYANADSIAHFLHHINPDQWTYQDLFDMMDEHLDLTTDEAVARHNMDYAADVAAYDSVHMEILDMSDFFTEGIVREFPHMFPYRMAQQNINLADNAIVLDQNSPNPFAGQTTIHYFIPENAADAQIMFMDYTGKTVKKVPILEKGEGTLTVYTADLNAGIYSYSIITDGKITESKKMVHQK
jgi:hypothetical protein